MNRKLKKIGDHIWAYEHAMSIAGMKIHLRTTIVKLRSGRLWVHSPSAFSTGLKEELSEIGTVGFIVGASNGHNLWLLEWQAAFPNAVLYVSGGIPKKLKLAEYCVLDNARENIWVEDLSHEFMHDVPFFNESVFLHKRSKSLIVTDFIQHHSSEKPSAITGVITK